MWWSSQGKHRDTSSHLIEYLRVQCYIFSVQFNVYSTALGAVAWLNRIMFAPIVVASILGMARYSSAWVLAATAVGVGGAPEGRGPKVLLSLFPTQQLNSSSSIVTGAVSTNALLFP